MTSFDSIFLFKKKPGTTSAFILEKRQGELFAPLETENSNGEKVCYLTKIQGKTNAKRRPTWNLSIPIINAKKFWFKKVNLSGVFIPVPEVPNKGFGDCKHTGNIYLFLIGENFETLTILVFRNQFLTVAEVLFTQFLDGEFDTEIAEFMEAEPSKLRRLC